jgi:nucleotide-binding universal stress UspA family protein
MTILSEPTWERITSQPSSRAEPWKLTGPLLVATDGTETVDAAMSVAEAIAVEHGLAVHVLSVLEPIASYYPAADGLMVTLPPVISDDARLAARRGVVQERVSKAVRDPEAWRIDVRVGPIAPTIADVANLLKPSLIVLGLGRHRPIDRLMGDEVAPAVIRLVSVPVLAVPRDAKAPLRRAIVATDFSRASVRAARAATAVVSPPAQLWLTHVRPSTDPVTEAHEGESIIYTQGVLGGFAKIRERLARADSIEIHPVILQGAPHEEILRFAADNRADLIVAGAHGHTLMERLLIGRVTTKLLRGAGCAVLVIPRSRDDRRRGA